MDETITYLLTALIAVSFMLSGFTAFKLYSMEDDLSDQIAAISTNDKRVQFTLPTGTPPIYGETLGVAYEDVRQSAPKTAEKTIQEFADYDTSITLTGELEDRYINILYRMNGGISCEYCCEAPAIITEDGESGCGCAHAYAMRGLTKYLLTEHGDEMTDEQIFTEIARWKTRYFPTQTKAKAAGLAENDVSITPVNLAANQYRGISSSDGGWVGEC